jgi:hypothetical protein
MLAGSRGAKRRSEMGSSYSSVSDLSNEQSPRARCIIEFIEGDVNRPPIVYPVGGSDEIDAAMVEAIVQRWTPQ